MLGSILNDIKLERAKNARDIEYLREMSIEDTLDDYVENAEAEVLGTIDTSDELLEAKTTLESMNDNDDESEKEEVQRIMEATEDMTFDEMINVESYVEKI